MHVMDCDVNIAPRGVKDDDVVDIKDEIMEIIILSDEDDNRSISDTPTTIHDQQTSQKPPSSLFTNKHKIPTVNLPDGRKLVELSSSPSNRKPPKVLTSLSLNSAHQKWAVSLTPSASVHKKTPSLPTFNPTPNKALHSSLTLNSTRQKGMNSIIVPGPAVQKTQNSLALNPTSSNALLNSLTVNSVQRKKVNLVIPYQLAPKKIPNLPKVNPAPINVVPNLLTPSFTRRKKFNSLIPSVSVPQKTPNPLRHNSILNSAKTPIITLLPSSQKTPNPPISGSTFKKILTSRNNFYSNPNNSTSQKTAPSTVNKTTSPPVNMGKIVYDDVSDVEPESEADDVAYDDNDDDDQEKVTEIKKMDKNSRSLSIDDEMRVFNKLIINEEESTHVNQDSRSVEKVDVETKKYVCELCHKPLPTNDAYIEHIQLHIIAELYNCKVCKKSFSMISKLKEHEKEHVEKHVCSICYLTFEVFDEFQKHSDRHRSDKKLNCNVCKKLCKSFRQLRWHSKKHLSNKPYVCALCEKSFKTAIHLQTHNKCHTLRKPLTCNICHKVFFNRPPFNQHVRRHRFDRNKHVKAKINFVGKSESQQNNKVKEKDKDDKENIGDGEGNKNVQEKDKVFICKFCDKSYSKRRSLTSHMSRKHWNGSAKLPRNFNLEKLKKGHVFDQKEDLPALPLDSKPSSEVVDAESPTTASFPPFGKRNLEPPSVTNPRLIVIEPIED